MRNIIARIAGRPLRKSLKWWWSLGTWQRWGGFWILICIVCSIISITGHGIKITVDTSNQPRIPICTDNQSNKYDYIIEGQ